MLAGGKNVFFFDHIKISHTDTHPLVSLARIKCWQVWSGPLVPWASCSLTFTTATTARGIYRTHTHVHMHWPTCSAAQQRVIIARWWKYKKYCNVFDDRWTRESAGACSTSIFCCIFIFLNHFLEIYAAVTNIAVGANKYNWKTCQ